MSLAGKVALTAGSTQGLGLQISKRLCRDGAKVFIGSREKENVQAALDEFKRENFTDVFGSTCHMMRSEDRQKFIKTAVDKYGKIDILINNVGWKPARNVKILDTEERDFDKIMNTNVKAMFFMIKETIPFMNPGGSIICMSSIVSHRADLLPTVYAVSKSAINGCVKALAPDLAELGIRINGISPGLFRTKFGNLAIKDDKSRERYLNACAMKRFGEPAEIEGIVSFLCSNDASYITGENIVVAGGVLSRL